MSKLNMGNITEALWGIFTAFLIWFVGLFLGGSWWQVFETQQVYETGYLVFLFPVLFFACCVIMAKYAAKKKAKIYFKSFMVSVFLPLISLVVFDIMMRYIPGVGYIGMVILFLVLSLSTPCGSIYSKMYDCIHSFWLGDPASAVIMNIVGFVPMILTLIFSVRVYKKYFVSDSKSDGLIEDESVQE